MADLRAPFPWFGGKSRAAALIWEALGDVPNFVEPFAGSLAVLLGRPHAPRTETVNDLDCYVSNLWRALAADPDAVAHHADWPVNEADLSARHQWLVNQAAFRERMATDPDYHDAKIAGWWVWGQCLWIGSGWCDLRGELPVGDVGRGVHRKLPHVGDAGQGVHRQLPHVSNAGQGGTLDYLRGLAARLRRVRVACGEWDRVLGDSVTWRHGLTGVVLDPPYRDGGLDYGAGGVGTDLSARVAAWAIEAGQRADMRVILCSYEGEHDMPASWRCVPWKARGGYGSTRADGTNANAGRERLWLSPACHDPTRQASLFGAARG